MSPLRTLKAAWIVLAIVVLILDAAASGCPIIAADRRFEGIRGYGMSIEDGNHPLSPGLRPSRRVQAIARENPRSFRSTNELRGKSDAGLGVDIAGVTTSSVPSPGSFLLLVCGGVLCSGGYFRRLVRRQI